MNISVALLLIAESFVLTMPMLFKIMPIKIFKANTPIMPKMISMMSLALGILKIIESLPFKAYVTGINVARQIINALGISYPSIGITKGEILLKSTRKFLKL